MFLALEEVGTPALGQVTNLDTLARAQLLAAFEIGRRYHLHRGVGQTAFCQDKASSAGNATFIALSRVEMEWRTDAKEWIGFVPVYASDRVGDLCVVERGVRTHVNVDPADLFGKLLAVKPRSFFLFHNHPSGNLTPSTEDLMLTEKARRMAEPLGLRLRGHWIVSGSGQRRVV